MNHRRVVITGLGAVSPLGNSAAELWEGLLEGRSGVAPLSLLPSLEGLVHFGGEATGFTGKIDNFGTLRKEQKKAIRKAFKVMCRETMMAVSAAQQAVADAGYDEQPMEPERSGIVFGCDYLLSPPDELADGMVKCGVRDDGGFRYSEWGQDGLREMSPLWMLKYLPNMPGSHIAIFNDLRGPNNSLTLREIAGVMAIREAAQTIARGHADRMIAGATGSRIHSFKTIHAVQQEQLADPNADPTTASRPFDANRTGMVVGEGAGAIILEELESARDRGATIYAEIVGTGSSTVTDSNLQGDPAQALANAARTALNESNITPAKIGHINAHGLGTTQGDAIEAEALAEVLGDSSKSTPVVAAKSSFGNLGAASGVVELIASTKALHEQKLFRTLNFETADPACPLAVVAEDGISPGSSFLKLSVTPQAQATALVVACVDG
ncbi:MAG: beta-ketoacyl-[acyl-carrier-protein] synthase family protein [Planctomycetes bacterium]|nr:beta-ketoacyl-[acyl-carrier-protein] synthase family protein [Planctomycetota bacterium]